MGAAIRVHAVAYRHDSRTLRIAHSRAVSSV
jgi:hypothetical protein